jgi:gamma-glutamyl phosphate reductase
MEPAQIIADLAAPARRAAGVLAASRGEKRNAALLACAKAIRDDADRLQGENSKDLARSEEFGLSQAASRSMMRGSNRWPQRSSRSPPRATR